MLASAHVADFYTMIARRYARYGWRRITKAYLKLADQERTPVSPSHASAD